MEDLSSDSNCSSQQNRHGNYGQISVLASCYMATPASVLVKGFHYCTTNGAGIHGGIPEVPSGPKTRTTSPPFGSSALLKTEDFWPRQKASKNAREAAQTIKEECERLFCDTLSVVFLGERNRRRRTSLPMGAYYQNTRPESSRTNHQTIDAYLEIWDYANDAIYRGFVAEYDNQKTLFVFFDDRTADHGIKNGLLALFELAEMEHLSCDHVVACVPRLADPMGLGIVRNLGWCGFSLTTLESWMTTDSSAASISDRWIFLVIKFFDCRWSCLRSLFSVFNWYGILFFFFDIFSFFLSYRMPFAKGYPALSVFPAFLLPSSLFSASKVNSQQRSQAAGDSPEDRALGSHISYIRCARCGTDICRTSQIISKGFTGRHGRAYLVSGQHLLPRDKPASISPHYPTSLLNTITQKPVPRQLVTGAHTVCDISCVICGSVLGWKYIAAEEESQRYKVGNFILETKRTSMYSCWEFDDTPLLTSENPNQAHDSAVEFDSQDEDECEDLFAGVWSPALATRRRSRRVDRQR
ncbi:ornithine decarboxylase antizyme-domain-containing protein [Talaromyces proteolyticus]|uniref:Ornithine decarboxylase antizyme-domain-containing protein n=1 Tax=Talaromyces proteolyticus TaxID=1131652 RepID=A0AAD4L0A5_9EURO|nr:ornithine decarboxylase antizyme-domain-containing protein [Talaromyces proteolyticus]KAH8704714.1 ornithine decarboxylase antizyme-domain-containing protein [Talaromyces proteolyticus]